MNRLLVATALIAPDRCKLLRAIPSLQRDAGKRLSRVSSKKIRRFRVDDAKSRKSAIVIYKFMSLVIMAVRLQRIHLKFAATQIQKYVRGMLCRHVVQPVLSEYRRVSIVRHFGTLRGKSLSAIPERYRPHVAATRIQSQVRKYQATRFYCERVQQRAAKRVQRAYNTWKWNVRAAEAAKHREEKEKEADAAIRIQSLFRGFRAHKSFRETKEVFQVQRSHSFALADRTRRLLRIAREASSLKEAIADTKQQKEEDDFLHMVLSMHDPNRSIVEWSTMQNCESSFSRKRASPTQPQSIQKVPAGNISSQSGKFTTNPSLLEPSSLMALVTAPQSNSGPSDSCDLRRIRRRAHAVAHHRLAKMYRGMPHETETMRYVLASKTPEDV